MMKKPIGLFILIISLYGTIFAQEGKLQVRYIGADIIETQPRQLVNITFQATNNTDRSKTFISKLELPEGWKSVISDFPFVVGPYQTDTRLISFFIPQGTPAGEYRVTYTVFDRDNPSISDYYSISVVVLSFVSLEVKLIERPAFVIAGEDYNVKFMVINKSNSVTRINLKIEDIPPFKCRIDSDEFDLAPAKSKIVTITVKTPSDLTEQVVHRLRLTAMTRDYKGEAITASDDTAVDVMPRTIGKEDIYHRIPVIVGLRSVNERGNSGVQTEISGNGTMDEEGNQHVSFLIVEPNLQQISAFGRISEEYFSFITKKNELFLGDKAYSLSPLTDYYHYGRGTEIKLHSNKFTVGGYSMESKWQYPVTSGTSFFLKYLKDAFKLGFNFLKKKDITQNSIWSINGEFKPFSSNLEFEYASSKNDNAYRIEARGYLKKISYSFKFIRAGPNYNGYYNDLDYKTVSLSLPFWNRFRLELNSSITEENLNRDPSRKTSLRENYSKIGLGYDFKDGSSITLEHWRRKRQDVLPQPAYNLLDEASTFRFWRGLKKISLSGSINIGKTRDFLFNEDSNLKEYIFSAYYTPNNRLSLGSFIQYSNELSTTSLNKIERINTGISLSYQISDKTNFILNYQNARAQSDQTYIQDIFSLSLNHRFNNQEFRFHGRWGTSGGPLAQSENAIIVEYIFPFNLPVKKKKNTGTLKGIVFDEESRKPIFNAILRLDRNVAVTDEKGNFIFPSLMTGEYNLVLDKRGIDLNKVTMQKMPMKVEIKGGKETKVEIRVVRSAQVTGEVKLYAFEDESLLDTKKKMNYKESHGLYEVYLELANSEETIGLITDEKGRFKAEEMRPGKWVLKIYEEGLPQYHYIEKNIFEFELSPGEKKYILVRVLPKLRKVKIIEEGETIKIEKSKKR